MASCENPVTDGAGPELLEGYGLNASARVSLLRSATNNVYLVRDAEANYILKLYDPQWRSESEIRWEIALVDHLTARGAPVAAVVPQPDGQQLAPLPAPDGIWHAVLYEHAPGHKPNHSTQEWTPQLFHSFGHATAHLHEASDDFTGPTGRYPRDLACLVEWPLERVLPHLHDHDDRRFLSDFAARCRERLEHCPTRGLDWGACHGDVALDNVHLAGGRFVFYDFDSGGMGWRAEDFTAVSETKQLYGTRFWDAFIDGYTQRRALGSDDLAAVSDFIPATCLWGTSVELLQHVLPRGTAAAQAYLRRRLDYLRDWDV